MGAKEAQIMSFGSLLKAARERSKLTQKALAAKAGLALSAVVKLEGEAREPSWKTVQELASALGVGCEEFMDRPPAEPAPTPARGPARKKR